MWCLNSGCPRHPSLAIHSHELIVPGFVRAHGGSDIRDVNVNSENWAVVKAALVAGMYPKLAHVDQDAALLSSSRKKKLHFHPTSVLSQSHFREVGQGLPQRSCLRPSAGGQKAQSSSAGPCVCSTEQPWPDTPELPHRVAGLRREEQRPQDGHHPLLLAGHPAHGRHLCRLC